MRTPSNHAPFTTISTNSSIPSKTTNRGAVGLHAQMRRLFPAPTCGVPIGSPEGSVCSQDPFPSGEAGSESPATLSFVGDPGFMPLVFLVALDLHSRLTYFTHWGPPKRGEPLPLCPADGEALADLFSLGDMKDSSPRTTADLSANIYPLSASLASHGCLQKPH